MYYMRADTPNAPITKGFILLHLLSNNRTAQLALINGETSNYFIRTKSTTSGVYSNWRRLITNDDLKSYKATLITFASENYEIYNALQTRYVVRNSVCYVMLNIKVITPISNNVQLSDVSLPLPVDDTYYWGVLSDNNGVNHAIAFVNGSGKLFIRGGTAGINMYGMFSYPIKYPYT